MRRLDLAAPGGMISVGGAARPAQAFDTIAEFARLEAEIGGPLGLSVIDTGSAARVAYRADKRFAICSTFKLLVSRLAASHPWKLLRRKGEFLTRTITPDAAGPVQRALRRVDPRGEPASDGGQRSLEVTLAELSRIEHQIRSLVEAVKGGLYQPSMPALVLRGNWQQS